MVRVVGRERAISDGVAECDDGARAWLGSDVDTVEEIPRGHGGRLQQSLRCGVVAHRDEVILVGEGVVGFGAHNLRREIEADCDIGERSNLKRDGIGKDGGSGWNVYRGSAAESDGVIAAGLD
jgi:hypothetical protein